MREKGRTKGGETDEEKQGSGRDMRKTGFAQDGKSGSIVLLSEWHCIGDGNFYNTLRFNGWD